MRDNIYVGLVHYPVYNRNEEVVATSVTNFDIHDISRTCRTYDIKKYFIITPVDAQQELTNRIINYWTEGDGIEFNKNRKEAFENTDLENSVETAIETIKKIEGKEPKIITTSARIFPNTTSYQDLGKEMVEDEAPYLILFGTGWGLTSEIMDMSYKILEPISRNKRRTIKMVGIVVVSHSNKLAEEIINFAKVLQQEDFEIKNGGDVKNEIYGTNVDNVKDAIIEADQGEGVLVFVDMGSSVFNANQAIESLKGKINAQIADAPLVEGVISAVAANFDDTSLEELKIIAEESRNFKKSRK